MTDFDLHQTFDDLGIQSEDIVMIHGDAGVAAQYSQVPPDKRLDHLIAEIKRYFSPNGTILVPAFSYSSTKNEEFDLIKTASEVGLFSERFRIGDDIKRSMHPIFSFSTWGKCANDFLDLSNVDCFGPGTLFEMASKRDVKLIALGCDFNTLTYVHYVEQLMKVSYRYFKTFGGSIRSPQGITKVETSYYVRDTNLKTECNLDRLMATAYEQGLLKVATIGRFPLRMISCANFTRLGIELITQDENALIDAGRIRNEV